MENGDSQVRWKVISQRRLEGRPYRLQHPRLSPHGAGKGQGRQPALTYTPVVDGESRFQNQADGGFPGSTLPTRPPSESYAINSNYDGIFTS